MVCRMGDGETAKQEAQHAADSFEDVRSRCNNEAKMRIGNCIADAYRGNVYHSNFLQLPYVRKTEALALVPHHTATVL